MVREGRGGSFNSSLSSLSVESLDNPGQEEEDLLADCISSAMPKSKSEHFDLSSKSKKTKKSPGRELPAMVREKSAPVLRREGREGSRSTSKSPRGSRLVPGVVIPELKLKPRSRPQSQEIKEIMEVKEIPISRASSAASNGKEAVVSSTKEFQEENASSMEQKQDIVKSKDQDTIIFNGQKQETTGSTRQEQEQQEASSLSSAPDSGLPSSLWDRQASLTQSGLSEAANLARALSLSSSSYSEAGPASLIQDTQPPSLMQDSLISLAPGRRPSTEEAASSPRLACRHTLSGKLGSLVPLAVRRALGEKTVGSSISQEDLSSLSSCHSNLEAIQPPTLLEELDMDSSLLSLASLSSEAQLLASTDSASLTSEAIREVVGPCRQEDPSLASSHGPDFSVSSVSQTLGNVAPPSLMEDLTLTVTPTLVAEEVQAGGTFVINKESKEEENNDTIADVETNFDDEETMREQTLTGGSEADHGVEGIPDLPRDSRGATPAQSGGESLESSPAARRRQGEMERTLTQSRLADMETGFRARTDSERFRTRTITKEDLSSPSSSPEKASPRSARQRRTEEAARFLTQTIGPGDLVRREEEEESITAAVLESEALRVVASLAQGRSRSQSADILNEQEMADSREDLLKEEEKPRPRVCKPWETRVQEQEVSPPAPGVRGRRRALYSPPMKRATVPPPVAPKPVLPSRSRPASSPQTSPRLVRGTRATQLRQAQSHADKGRATSPRSTSSPRALASPRTISPSVTSPRSPRLRRQASEAPLVRQGTFTKEDKDETSTSTRKTSASSLPTKRTPPKPATKPMFPRRDTVSPSPGPRPTISPRPTKTQTLREQSLIRGTPTRSSASSSSSAVSRTSATSLRSLRTSSSSHSLRSAAETAALPRRVPSSSDIERRRPMGPPAPVVTTTPPRPAPQPRKNVTSKIASLWKKVEDSKLKSKADESSKKYKPKDHRVWLGGGRKQEKEQEQQKPPAPAPGKLIRSGTYEKLTEEPVPDTVDSSKTPRSRSRLSMKLSKFSLKRRPSTTPALEDQVNGNIGQEVTSPQELGSPDLPSSGDSVMSTGTDTEATARPPLQTLSNRCLRLHGPPCL